MLSLHVQLLESKNERLYKMGSIYLSLVLVFQFLSFCFFEVVGFNNERRGANI